MLPISQVLQSMLHTSFDSLTVVMDRIPAIFALPFSEYSVSSIHLNVNATHWANSLIEIGLNELATINHRLVNRS